MFRMSVKVLNAWEKDLEAVSANPLQCRSGFEFRILQNTSVAVNETLPEAC